MLIDYGTERDDDGCLHALLNPNQNADEVGYPEAADERANAALEPVR
jgi:hypothetical protein